MRYAMMMPFLSGLAACTAAYADEYDSSNPIHCVAIFGATSAVTRTGPLADELNARILHIVQAEGGEAWLRRITPIAQQVGVGWEASPNREQAIQLFEECRAHQDADPSFRSAFPGLLQQGRQISSTSR